MEGSVHCERHQTNRKEACCGGYAHVDVWEGKSRPTTCCTSLVEDLVWNTAFIERLNGTIRERFAVLTRKCRHAARRLQALKTGMYLVGCTYNFCFPHHELSKEKHLGFACTPAMAAGLTDHAWSIGELLSYGCQRTQASRSSLAKGAVMPTIT